MTRAKAEKIRKGIDDKVRKATVDMEWWTDFWGFTVKEYEEFLDMAVKALDQPTVQTIQDSCITIHGISSKYLEDKHDGKILVYTEKGCRTYHWFGDDEE